jgi:hypothetical protein
MSRSESLTNIHNQKISEWQNQNNVTPKNDFRNPFELKQSQSFEDVPANSYFKNSSNNSNAKDYGLRFKKELPNGSFENMKVDALNSKGHSLTRTTNKMYRINVGKSGSRTNRYFNGW